MTASGPKHIEINNKELIKKCILMALLLAVLLFLFIERDCLRNEEKVNIFPEGEGDSVTNVSVLGNHTIEQPITAQSDSIGSIGVRFYNPEKNTASGKVVVELLNSAGSKVAGTELDASLIKENARTRFLLGGDSEGLNANRIVTTYGTNTRKNSLDLKKGAKYTLRITTEDIASEGPVDIVLINYTLSEGDESTYAVIDGKTQDKACLNMNTVNRIYSGKTVALFLFMIFATLIFVLLPFEKIDESYSRRTGRPESRVSTWITRAMFVLAPTVSYFIIQKYIGYGLFRFLRQLTSDSGKGILNLLIIGCIWWLIYTISNRVRFTSMLTCLLASAFGFINYILILFRDTPLVATDIAQFGTAMQVVDTYTVSYDKPFLWAILLTSLWCIASYAPPGHPGIPLKKRVIPLAVLFLWFGTAYYTFFVSSFIEDHGLRVSSFKPKGSYVKNGCALSFMISLRNSIVKKPDGYEIEKIEAVAAEYSSDKAEKAEAVSEKNPNVIIIMNESFSDLSMLGEFKTNQDFLPFYRSLSDNTIRGWMSSSVFGGSTANSEFECLTGFSMRFLPFQSVPYRSVIKEKTPSLSGYMTAMGYGGNIVFHPGMRNSYNRDKVYPLLGFDTHIAYEDLNEPGKIRDYVSDEYDYEFVEKKYEEYRENDPDRPFYMFNVTIQNHGGYDFSTGIVDSGIEILSTDSQAEQALQFLNLMKKSDEALEHLIEYYSNVDEETVIMLFGDHQPRVETEFYQSLHNQHKGISELEWSEMKHEVPFMIWANYDIDEDSGNPDKPSKNGNGELCLSANYMAPYLKKTLGLPMTGFDKYLLELYTELPVINAICYEDAEGILYDPSEESKYDERLLEYEQLQYNGLIDGENRIDEFFTLKE